MSTKVAEPPLFPYPVIELIGSKVMHYSALLNSADLIKQYGNVNILAGEIHKLITLRIVEAETTYSPEDGSDFKLSLTSRGKNMLKNWDHNS